MTTTYKVGQVLYLVPTKQAAVYPVQVVEEITKKTLEGTETDYVLRAGGAESKTIHLKEIQGEIFETADRARSILTERATRSVVRMVEAAHKKAQEWYPGSFEGSSDGGIIDVLRHNSDPNESSARPQTAAPTIQLEDGTMVRVKLPDVLKG